MAHLNNVRFPDGLAVGAVYGPEFVTEVAPMVGGKEKRNRVRRNAMCVGDVSHSPRLADDYPELLKFFRAVNGRFSTFRFKDYTDFECAQAESSVTGLGDFIFQLNKVYVAGSLEEIRDIQQPVVQGFTLYVNDVAASLGTGVGEYTLDDALGIVTMGSSTASIASATVAANAVFELSGVVTGQRVKLSDMVGSGWSALNNTWHTATSIDATHFTLGIDSSGFASFVSGTATRFLQADSLIQWAGEFDNAVRFDTDRMATSIDACEVFTWGGIPIKEQRL